MKLVNSEYNISLEFEENRITLMVIEEKSLRLKIVEDLYQQCRGEEGSFILSEDTQMLKMNKVVEFLLSPFSIEYNNRKILTKLYQEIEEYGNENFYSEKQKINSEIISLLDKIMLNVPYNITTKLDVDMVEICKLYNVQIENTGNTLLENLVEYIKLMNQLCGCKLFILLNFMLLLPEQELKKLHEFAFYQKVYLLFIEYTMPAITEEMGCIIDEDGCIIDLVNHDLQH